MSQIIQTALSLLNDIAVGVFGVLLSFSFGGALKSRRNRAILMCCIALMLFFHWMMYSVWSVELGSKLYPLIVHLPTVLLMCYFTKKPLWSVVSVLCAYLFCEIRRWFALLTAELFNGRSYIQNAAEIIITVPLLLFLMRFAAPAIRQIMDYPIKTQLQFGVIPAIYYVFDYVTRIYTGLLSGGSPAVMEFMPFVCCAAYLMFLLYNLAEERKRQRFLQIQSNLDIQLSQAVREITRLREAQAQTARYRHDLRHHLLYISACLENGQNKRAQSYISEICEEIEAQKIVRYCENEAANLILSAFAGHAKKHGINMEIHGNVSEDVALSDNDLCVLLSNSLENALNACLPLAESGKLCVISVRFRYAEATGKFFVQITNPYSGEIGFENGIPVSSEPDHGFGVQSVCAIAERYGGCYSFSTENDLFILRLSILDKFCTFHTIISHFNFDHAIMKIAVKNRETACET